MKHIVKKKRIILVFTILTSLSIFSNALQITQRINFDVSTINYYTVCDDSTGTQYTAANWTDMSSMSYVGRPALPKKIINIAVPFKAHITSVSISPSLSFVKTITNYPFVPAQEDWPLDSINRFTPPDSVTYSTGFYYPNISGEMVGEGFMCGENHYVTIALYPMQFSPTLKQTLTRRYITVTVNYDTTGVQSNGIFPIIRDNEEMRQKERQDYSQYVVNSSSVEGFKATSTLQHKVSLPPPASTMQIMRPCQYLILTTGDLLTSIKRMVALKRQKGYSVNAVCVDSVLNSGLFPYGDVFYLNGDTVSTINDSPGIIRQYLKSMFQSGTEYLLSAGVNVPFRCQYHYSSHETPTDLYYSNLTTNWNKNWNGLYAEYQQYNAPETPFDFSPNLYVGRLLFRNETDVNNYTDKLFRYELNPGNGDFSYLRRALYTQGCEFKDHNHADIIARNLITIHPDTTIMNEIKWQRWPDGSDIINEINQTKYGFMSFHNHGSPSSIITYGFNYESKYLWLWALDGEHITSSSYGNRPGEDNALDLLNNKFHPSILYSIACTTTPFDTYVDKDGYVYDVSMNFGQSFTLGKDYGGPAFLGNSRNGWFTSSTNLEYHFAKSVTSGKYKLGCAEAISKMTTKELTTAALHNLIGDPELEMWTDIPQTFSSVSIVRSNDGISISSLPNDSCIVAYSNNDAQGMMHCASGSVILDGISPNSTIMVYRHNYIPYIAPLLLQNDTVTDSQYVLASTVTAGNHVDSNRTAGDLVISEGAEYEIEAKGVVRLEGGFRVEKGATFRVMPAAW